MESKPTFKLCPSFNRAGGTLAEQKQRLLQARREARQRATSALDFHAFDRVRFWKQMVAELTESLKAVNWELREESRARKGACPPDGASSSDRTTGLMAIGVDNDLRPFLISIRGVEVGTLFHSHFRRAGMGAASPGEPEVWKVMIYGGKQGNVTFKACNSDVEQMKQWCRDNIMSIWKYVPVDTGNRILIVAQGPAYVEWLGK